MQKINTCVIFKRNFSYAIVCVKAVNFNFKLNFMLNLVLAFNEISVFHFLIIFTMANATTIKNLLDYVMSPFLLFREH